MNTQEIADRIVSFIRANKGRRPDMKELGESIRREFPAVTPEQFGRALEVAMADLRAEAEQHMAEARNLDAVHGLLNGCPAGTTLAEAARMKAAAGDPVARSLLAKLDSRESRVSSALLNAAATAHPDWEPTERGVRRRKGAPTVQHLPDPTGDLVDWFQRTHPDDARAIEDAIGWAGGR